jgi:hypothetical protein
VDQIAIVEVLIVNKKMFFFFKINSAREKKKIKEIAQKEIEMLKKP